MATVAPSTNTRIALEVADDLMTAVVRLRETGDSNPVTREAVLDALGQAKIQVTDDVQARVDEFVALVNGPEPLPEPFVIAQ